MSEITPTETIIEDALTDNQLSDIDTETSTEVDTASDVSDTSASDTPDGISDTPEPEAAVTKGPEDDFSKKFGIPSKSPAGSENRIPYSRVKKIVEKAQKEAKEAALKESTGASQPKLVEYETKIKGYEDRLTQVGQFEHILENDPQTFLKMLSKVPAYKQFFDFVGQAAQQLQRPAAVEEPQDEMPTPDQQLADGTTIYSPEQFKKYTEWQAGQIEGRLSKKYEARLQEVNQRLTPFEQAQQREAHVQQLIPQINAQIAEARTWPQFAENEAEITAALAANTNLSLEGAYRQVVVPKLMPQRDSMRKDLLQEIKKTPQSTAVSTRASRPSSQTPTGPRDTEDIIREAIAKSQGGR